MDDAVPTQPDPSMRDALVRLGLIAAGGRASFTPLVGGVSSDIWRVDADGRRFCVKRALAKLKVAADWRAPVERSRYEAAWFRAAGAIVPDAVPHLLADDPAAGLFAVEWLDPADYRLWKGELRDGRADPAAAATVGAALAKIHAGTAGDAAVAAAFPTDEIFYAIRLEPYLVATAAVHPGLAAPLSALVATTAATRRALVHGDVSPKNILLGPRGPVFLDAECAWYGDPAFDIAFCLNHLLLKCLWAPAARAGFLRCFDALARSWLAGVAWEPRAAAEKRAAQLLPGLLLARVDGKSPVEYLQAEDDKAAVRRVGRALLLAPPERLAEVRDAWAREIEARETASWC